MKVDFDKALQEKINNAVNEVFSGTCTKVIVNDNIKVYKCTSIVRIDLKIAEPVGEA